MNDSLTHQDESGLVLEELLSAFLCGGLRITKVLPALLNENRIVKQEEVMNLLIKLVQVGRVTQIHFIFFANCSRNLVIEEDATACLFSGGSLY